jgi:hypothetical protein
MHVYWADLIVGRYSQACNVNIRFGIYQPYNIQLD